MAKEYSKRIGYVSSVLSANIRLLCWNDRPGMEALLPLTKYHVGWMVRGPNFKSMLYHFTDLVARQEISGRTRLTVGEMLDLYRSNDSLPAHMYPFPETKTRAQELLTAFTLFEPAWIERSRRDTSPQKTPSLFHQSAPAEEAERLNPSRVIGK